MSKSSRIPLEIKTVSAMVRMFCRKNHGTPKDLCTDCQALLEYAMARLDRCRFGAEKPSCQNCTVHCYKPAMREKIKDVMRFSGPKMLLHHPILALVHLYHSMRKCPPVRKAKEA